eukprot:scaffold1833_cov255-Pinguiococcus_pyrenoidosus.AAC.10
MVGDRGGSRSAARQADSLESTMRQLQLEAESTARSFGSDAEILRIPRLMLLSCAGLALKEESVQEVQHAA